MSITLTTTKPVRTAIIDHAVNAGSASPMPSISRPAPPPQPRHSQGHPSPAKAYVAPVGHSAGPLLTVLANSASTSSTFSSPPPAKRRRVENGDGGKNGVEAESRSRGLKDCLTAQVLPHVSAAVMPLSAEKYSKNSLAVEVVSRIITDSHFQLRVDATRGYLTKADENGVMVRSRELVAQLSKVPMYWLDQQTMPSSTEKPELSESTTSERSEASTDEPHSTPIAAVDAAPAPTTTMTETGQRRPATKWWNQGVSRASSSKCFHLQRRPYQTAADRKAIMTGAKQPSIPATYLVPSQPHVYHVDFTEGEVAQLVTCMAKYFPHNVPATASSLKALCPSYPIPSLVGDQLAGRTAEDIRGFCSDLMSDQALLCDDARVLSLEVDRTRQVEKQRRAGRTSALLLSREMEGSMGFGRTRQLVNVENELSIAREDDMDVVAEFTNCAGDIATISWTSEDDFVAGTTAHSDSHNQQYNKPGNLLLCSTKQGTLKAFPDHRIPRPLVDKGENSTEAMRRSQDPWLYSSVVSSDYDVLNQRAYTSSFDKSVKVWKIDQGGQKMAALATWKHQGNVNFVVAAKDGSGRVAAAADVPAEAVRVYHVNEQDIENSPFQTFSCTRPSYSDKWAYYPATMQWGRAPGAQHLLVVGYSPRSYSGDDHDIPEDKRNSGEITLWDANQNRCLPVMTASTANVFEVTWHPTLPRFIVATSPCGLIVEHRVRTQIHLFQRDRDRDDGAYVEFQSLDCSASDVNELSIMPNSLLHAYVTAACTDGKVYVWDTAQGDKPIHVLRHGHPLEEFYEDREKEDTGVKFTAWGSTPDRFYTGGSDGVVNVWNLRQRQRPHIRTLVEAPGPISCGAFSPDLSKLAIGDATGRVFLLSVDDRDTPESHFATLPGSSRRIRRPKPFIPHAEPPPPPPDPAQVTEKTLWGAPLPDDGLGYYVNQKYFETRQLYMHPSRRIGVVKCMEYLDTGLFRREAHLNDDPSAPLLPEFERLQQETLDASRELRVRALQRLGRVSEWHDADKTRHDANRTRNLDLTKMDKDDLADLVKEGAMLHISDEDWGLEYEEIPDEVS